MSFGIAGSFRLRFANHDVAVRAVDDYLQLRLLRSRYAELVECLLKVIHERLPFFWRDVQLLVRLTHRAPGIFLRAATGPADHFCNQILKAGGRHLVMRFIHGGIGVQAGISHDAVDEIINHRRDAINSAEAFVEGSLIWWHGWMRGCRLLFYARGLGPSHSVTVFVFKSTL